MPIHVTVNVGWARGSESLLYSVPLANEGADDRNVTVPGETENLEVDLAFTVAQLTHVLIRSNADVTLVTNNPAEPGDTIVLSGSVPFAWIVDSGIECPFTVDVTKLYLTNAGEDDADVVIRILRDATPE